MARIGNNRYVAFGVCELSHPGNVVTSENPEVTACHGPLWCKCLRGAAHRSLFRMRGWVESHNRCGKIPVCKDSRCIGNRNACRVDGGKLVPELDIPSGINLDITGAGANDFIARSHVFKQTCSLGNDIALFVVGSLIDFGEVDAEMVCRGCILSSTSINLRNIGVCIGVV